MIRLPGWLSSFLMYWKPVEGAYLTCALDVLTGGGLFMRGYITPETGHRTPLSRSWLNCGICGSGASVVE